MSIRPIARPVYDRDVAFTRAYELIANSKIVRMIDGALLAAAGNRSGRPPTGPYRTGPILVVMAMCVYLALPCTYANMLTLLWYLSPSQLAMLGLEEVITDRKRAELDDRGVSNHHQKALGKAFRRICSVMDCNPHPQNSKETNATRWRREAGLTKRERADLAQRDALLNNVVDAILRTSLKGGRPSWYRGHVTFDETWLKSRIRTQGRGTRADKLACPDPTLAWRNDKETHRPIYVVMLVLTAAAAMPYEQSVPLLVTGARIRLPSGESSALAGLAAVESHIRNGFGTNGRAPGRGYADRDYTKALDLPRRMLDLGYMVSADADQEPPSTRFRLATGAFLLNGVFICPAGEHLLKNNHLRDLNEDAATDEELARRQELVDEFRKYRMPTNGRPVPYPPGSKWAGHARVTLICPAAAKQLQCKWVPESMESNSDVPVALVPPPERRPACMTTFSSVRIQFRDLKHLDLDIRGSFEHADAFNFNRSAMEKINGFVKRHDMQGFESEDMQPFGRVPMGLCGVIACAFYNQRTIDEIVAEHGSIDNMPPTPRAASAAGRDRRIRSGRDKFDHPRRNRKNDRNTRP